VAGFVVGERCKANFDGPHCTNRASAGPPGVAARPVELTIFLARSPITGCANARSDDTRKDSYMTQGTVKWFNSQKGFGFIQPDDGGNDVFVHISAVERAGMAGLNEGQKVAFEVVANRKTGKSSAENLRAI
jgi:cold shock protein